MRFQDTLRFSLELVLPEKLINALEKAKSIGASESLPPGLQSAPPHHLRLLVEEIDRERHGGLTFGQDTIELMTVVLDRAIATLPQPVETQQVRQIINCIQSVAGDGERNPGRLLTKALGEFEQNQSVQ